MVMADDAVRERLFKIKTLRDRALTDGERAAADAALQRGLQKAGLVEADLKAPVSWPRGLPPAGTRVMTPHGPGVVQADARVLLDPPPVMQSFVINIGGLGGGFGGGLGSFGGFSFSAGTDTSTGGFTINF